MQVDFGGQSLVLSPERAVFWPAQRALLIADAHFGKAGVFRRAGVPIPEGIDAHDLSRLSRLISLHAAQRLIVLGDFFHGRPEASSGFLAAFSSWLDQHPLLRIDVVAGNHDRHGGADRWPGRIRWHSSHLDEPPFVLAHAPAEHDAPLLCGHLHPMMNLYSQSGDHLRLPAFHFAQRCVTLPAFGRFTGGAAIRPQPQDRVYVIAEDEIFLIGPA